MSSQLEQEVQAIIEQFESLKEQELTQAVKYVSRNPDVTESIRSSLRSQPSNCNGQNIRWDYIIKLYERNVGAITETPGLSMVPKLKYEHIKLTSFSKMRVDLAAEFYQALFQWLYSCAQLKTESNELYNFVLQFAPDLVIIYLHGIYENKTQLKASSEALLMALLLETEKEKVVVLQVPKLSKPSIYHQSAVQISQPLLTEAMLKRHNQTEALPTKPTFSGKPVTVNNRLTFLSTVMEIFADRMIAHSTESQVAFCQSCIRLSLQGMHRLCISQVELDESCGVRGEELGAMRRYSVSDSFISSLLRGVRMCLFQSCHSLALKALQALRVRAEYELLTISIQVSHSLARLVEGMASSDLQLNTAQHSSYHKQGQPTFSLDPSHIHTALNSHILFHNLTKEPQQFQSSPSPRHSASNVVGGTGHAHVGGAISQNTRTDTNVDQGSSSVPSAVVVSKNSVSSEV